MKILGFFSHLDDAEIWAGGTLAKHSMRGDWVETFMFAEDDDPRLAESKEAHKIIGAHLTASACNIHTDKQQAVDKLKSYIVGAQPDVLITHWYDDCHADHRRTFEIVSEAIVEAWIQTLCPKALFACDTYSSQGIRSGFNPTHYIDVTAVWDKKMEAIAQFKSQPFEMWQTMITKQNALFGERVMRKYAEGFMQVPIQGKLCALEHLL